MAAKRAVDVELSSLDALLELSAESAEPLLARALADRNNLIVARAAAITLHHRLAALIPNLAEAFMRFLGSAAKSDPQCWAKNSLAKALAELEYQDPELFLAGMRHIQLEPGWGGSADSAGTLRSTCALALVQCRELNSHRVLVLLTPLLADKEPRVRVNAARAIEQVGTDSAVLLLRLLAELATDPELLGACYSGVLALDGPSALAWAERFLHQQDDAAAEAALAIAQTHTAEAFQLLRAAFGKAAESKAGDPWFRNTVLAAIALTRRQEATDWLLDLVANDDGEAAGAYEALCRSAPSEATLERLRQLGRPCRENHPDRSM